MLLCAVGFDAHVILDVPLTKWTTVLAFFEQAAALAGAVIDSTLELIVEHLLRKEALGAGSSSTSLHGKHPQADSRGCGSRALGVCRLLCDGCRDKQPCG
eukprot:6204427-Pleurochrysis_carterae.AAC.5